MLYSGKADILVQLQQNYRQYSIYQLCQIVPGGTCVVTCFSFAEPLKPYLEPFNLMSRTYSSDLFNRFWQDKLTELCRTKSLLSFLDIAELVWKPVFIQCQKLLNDLQSWKLMLCEVDHFFKKRYRERNAFFRDLMNLSQAVNKCQRIVKNDSGWINDVIDRIWQYWELCNYHEAAQAFINIRDTLGLTGDFSFVERVATQVMFLWPVGPSL